MAYCPNCGAYIPEGQTECAACNTNLNAVPQSPAAVEMTAEKASEKKTTCTSERTGETPTAEKPAEGFDKANKLDKSRILAILSYLDLWILPFIIAKDDELAVYHARQGIVITVLSIIVRTVFKNASVLGFIAYAVLLVLAVKGMMNAYKGEKKPIPYIGQFVEKK